MFERFFRSSTANTARVSRALSRGEIRRIRRGLYTTDLATPLPELVHRHIWEIVRIIAPGTVIGYRTAFELKPSADGVIHLVGPKKKRLELHGTRILIHEGPGPLNGDQPYMDALYLASQPRAFLEVLKPSRSGREFGHKGLSESESEERLDKLLRVRGEDGLHKLRDEARALREDLNAEDEFRRLDAIIGALLRT